MKRKPGLLSLFLVGLLSSGAVQALVKLKALDDKTLSGLSLQAKTSVKEEVTPVILSIFLQYLRDSYQLPYAKCVADKGAKLCDMRVTRGRAAFGGYDFFIPFLMQVTPKKNLLQVSVKQNPYLGNSIYFVLRPILANNQVSSWSYDGSIWNINYQNKQVELPYFRELNQMFAEINNKSQKKIK